MNKHSNIFLVCTGLGRINRGYESFTRECFDALKDSNEFNLILVKGGGKKVANEFVIPNLHRKHPLSIWLSSVLKLKDTRIEEFTFFLFLLPLIFRKKPSVIYYSDFILGTYLWHIRRLLNLKYKLLFSNGAPNGPPFKTEDHVQQLLPMYVTDAKAQGVADEQMTLLPYAININLKEKLKWLKSTQECRETLGLPPDKKIIISVGAVNTHHKRMHYVIEEFSKLDQDKYFLIILGQVYAESKDIIRLAKEKIENTCLFKEVGSEEVPMYMAASDYFILASLSEGLPRVLPEALSNGLIPIVHDYNVTRQTLNKYGVYKNMTTEGALAEAIKEVDEKDFTKQDIVNFAWEKYSWESLKNQYVSMILKR